MAKILNTAYHTVWRLGLVHLYTKQKREESTQMSPSQRASYNPYLKTKSGSSIHIMYIYTCNIRSHMWMITELNQVKLRLKNSFKKPLES